MKTFILDMGNTVLCDDCNEDWTDKTESGGILFQSKAICPNCQENWIKDAKKYHEEHFIKAKCPPNKSFANWVREDLR